MINRLRLDLPFKTAALFRVTEGSNCYKREVYLSTPVFIKLNIVKYDMEGKSQRLHESFEAILAYAVSRSWSPC